MRFAGLLLLGVVLQVGCTDDPAPVPPVSVTDSAGVVMVRVESLRSLDLPRLRLDTLFRSSETDVDLFGVAAARVLDGGRVAVADAGNQQVLILDLEGAQLATVGREGEGPGEFRRIATLHRRPGGGFSTYDTGLGRWTHFDTDGNVAATVTMSPPSRSVDLTPLTSAGRDVMAIYGRVARMPAEGIQRDSTPLLHYRAPGAPPDTLSLWAIREASYEETESGWAQTTVGFGRSLAAFGSGTWVVLGDTDRLELSVFDAAGRLVMTIRGEAEPISTTEHDGERWREDLVAGLGSGMPAELREEFVERFRRAPFRESYPAFDRAAVDTAGRVWVGTTARYDDPTRAWIVFGVDGTPLGEVTLPADTEILDLTGTHLLTLTRNDLGVEEVTAFAVNGID